MDSKTICNLIDSKKDDLFNLLSSLIKINSENFSSHGNEKEIAQYIKDYCADLGFKTDMFSPLDIDDFENHPDYFPGRNLENRYSVVTSFKGTEDKNSLMLMAHLDTVEIGDRDNWDIDPLGGTIKGNKIYGRGACDDKYAVAVCMFLFKLLKENNFVPKKNLLFTAYCDEEYGGSHGALSSVIKYPCERIVSMDGKENQIWNCASGGQEAEYLFHTTQSVGSAEMASRAIPHIMDCINVFADNRRDELNNNRFYKDTYIPSQALRYLGASVGDSGGTNPGSGKISFEYYTDKTKDEIFAEYDYIEKILSEKLAPMGITGVGIKPTTRFFHYVFCEPDSDDIKLMIESSKEACNITPVVCGSCQSDLSVIMKYGSKRAFGFGCGKPFDKEGGAHQINEFISCDSLLNYTKTIATYILKILG